MNGVDALSGDASVPSVVLLRWPRDAVRRDHLASAGVPRLLLVEAGNPPPTVMLGIEDWIRVPADEHDLIGRVDRLAGQLRSRCVASPTLDDLVLHNGDLWVGLSPIEAAIVAPLINRFGELITRDEIGAAGWDDGIPRGLNSRIRSLRNRLAKIGLRLTTVYARGYMLGFASETPDQRYR